MAKNWAITIGTKHCPTTVMPCGAGFLAEIQNNFGFHTFNISTYKQFSKWLLPFAISSDKGMALVGALIDEMRLRQIIIPAISTVERLAWKVRHRAQKVVCLELTKSLTTLQKTALEKRAKFRGLTLSRGTCHPFLET